MSNYQGWVSNDGNTNVFAVDSAHVTSAFGHSRTYYVEKGKANFMRWHTIGLTIMAQAMQMFGALW